jgi:hypothetical protein
MEQHYAFLKDNRVVQIAVFASQDDELANRIVEEQSYDNAVWVGETVPVMHSFYDGTLFTPPTPEYLISIGVLSADSQEEEPTE